MLVDRMLVTDVTRSCCLRPAVLTMLKLVRCYCASSLFARLSILRYSLYLAVVWTAVHRAEPAGAGHVIVDGNMAAFFALHIFVCYAFVLHVVAGIVMRAENTDMDSWTSLDAATVTYYKLSPLAPLLFEMCKYLSITELEAMIRVSHPWQQGSGI